MDKRLEALKNWVYNDLGLKGSNITPASEDASFRRYFRIRHQETSYIVMDAPPDKEDCTPFIRLAKALSLRHLNVPRILEMDLKQGFLLISDLGEQLYLDHLDLSTADALYQDAIAALIHLQTPNNDDNTLLPPYDADLLLNEMHLFDDWFITQHLNLSLTHTQLQQIDDTYTFLANAALAQPQVWVHRDYHSRNLMITPTNNPGVIDFQDAVIGPISYDLVSLLKDCYIDWPRDRIEQWVSDYYQQACEHQIITDYSHETFLTHFDLMGVQRHLKAIGIFARLNIRDHKPGYLNDIPRCIDYIIDCCKRYEELSTLHALLITTVLPGMRNIDTHDTH